MEVSWCSLVESPAGNRTVGLRDQRCQLGDGRSARSCHRRECCGLAKATGNRRAALCWRRWPFWVSRNALSCDSKLQFSRLRLLCLSRSQHEDDNDVGQSSRQPACGRNNPCSAKPLGLEIVSYQSMRLLIQTDKANILSRSRQLTF